MADPIAERPFQLPQSRWKISPRVRKVIALSMALLAIVILGRMIYTNWNSLQDFEWKVRPIPLAGSFLFYIFYIGVAALSWGSILKSLGSTSSRKQHFRVYYLSTLANRLPVPFANIVGRFFLYDESTPKKTLTFASGFELLLVALAGLAIVGVFRPKSVSYFNGWVILPGILIGLIMVHPRVLKPLLKLLKLPVSFELRYWYTIRWLLSYLLVWLVGGTALYLLIIAFYPLPLLALPNIIGAWCLSGLIGIVTIFLPVGLGLHEVTLSFLLSSFLPPAISAIIAIISRIVFTLFEIILAGIAFWLKN